MAKKGDEFVLITGNQLGILFTDYIAGRTENPETKTMVTSVVSTPMVNRMAESYGIGMRRTLVGFKYIG